MGIKPKPKGTDPKPKPKPKGTDPKPKPKPKGAKSDEPMPKKPKNTTDSTSEDPKTWYKTGVAYDTKRTGLAATPPEGLLNVSRKRKAGCQPKKSGGPSVNKRKRTTPAKWMPCTQPRTTYTMGDKITPGWGLTHRGDMDPAENWSIPRYSPPKLTEKQEAAWQEAHRDKKKYKRYKTWSASIKKKLDITKRKQVSSYPFLPSEGYALRLVTNANKRLVSKCMPIDFYRKQLNGTW